MPIGLTRSGSWTCAFPGRSETSLVPRTVARTGSAVAAPGQRSRRETKQTRSIANLGEFTDDPPRETGRHRPTLGALMRSAPAASVAARSRQRFIARNAETAGSFHPPSTRGAFQARQEKCFRQTWKADAPTLRRHVERRLVRHGANPDVEPGRRGTPRVTAA